MPFNVAGGNISKVAYDNSKEAKETANQAKTTANEAKSSAAQANQKSEKTQTEMNNIIREQTQNGDLAPEIAQARGNEATLGERLNSTDSKLAQTGDNMNKEVLPKSKARVPMMTFIDDDGRREVLEKWEPILQAKRIKMTIALVTSWVEKKSPTVIQWDEIQRLKDSYGVEFVSHTHEHGHGNNLTEAQIHAEFKQAREILQREGLTHDIIVQPYGENSEPVRRISRDYARANVGTKEGINYPPLETYRLKRVTLGEETNNTFEYYKSIVDEAIANNGWIIWKSHSQYTSFDSTQIQHIMNIIDYARSNGVEIVGVHEGLDRVGNIIDVGDYVLRDDASSPEYTVMDYQGVIHSKSNSKDYYMRKYNSATVTTSLYEFPKSAVTSDTIVSENATGFPENKPGVLETYRTEASSNSFQLYYIFDTNDVYKRRWEASNWTPFVKVMQESKDIMLNLVVDWVTVPPQTASDVIVKNSNVKLLDYIQGSPRSGNVDGIMVNVFIRNDNEIVVRYYNTTQTSIVVPATRFNFRVIKT